ncbi:nuclear transport factor 2 family protein [Georgenia yuyongxinii]|uniref:Nuclear transport factor 2 family protein n=1 Tax=Georgenia yuyongxinii TaxID=2589797 RepID=A0A552WRM8_9MICO|nr:nuclear transport factor 2 family protein [Georgenia yuyongxinii]TRW45269.1 nuclear transport factor 2 family protein [Georgenia yuyongxinii]
MTALDPRDAEEIKSLKARYFRYIDTKQWDRLRTVFTDDASFDGLWASAPTPEAFIETISKNLGRSDVVTVHQGFMPELRALDADRARGIWGMEDYLTWPAGERAYLGVSVPGQRGIRGYGHYEEDYRRTSDGWRISFLRLTRLRIDPIVGDPGEQPVYPFVRASTDWLEQVDQHG